MNASVVLRRLGPGDAEKYRSILEHLSEEDRYYRFFRHVDHFEGEVVDRFVEIRSDAVGVIAERDGIPLGAAHAFFEGPGIAELSIVVSRDAQGRGIGKLLFVRLLAALAAGGCDTLIARSLDGNEKFAALARSVGMSVVSHEGGVTTWSRTIGTYAVREPQRRAAALRAIRPRPRLVAATAEPQVVTPLAARASA